MSFLRELGDKETRLIVGLMSGTSGDGIDAVAAEISGCGSETGFRVAAHVAHPLPPALQTDLFELFLPGAAVDDPVTVVVKAVRTARIPHRPFFCIRIDCLIGITAVSIAYHPAIQIFINLIVGDDLVTVVVVAIADFICARVGLWVFVLAVAWPGCAFAVIEPVRVHVPAVNRVRGPGKE